MSNVAPFNLIMAPYVVWIAPVGTTFPAIDNPTPASPWALIGGLGAEDYEDDGVTVSGDQKVEGFRGAAQTALRKVTRTEEDLMFTLKMADMTLEQIRHSFNENVISSQAAISGAAGYKSMNLYQGVDVATVSICVRGYTPYSGDSSGFGQFEIPNCYQSGKPKIQYAKGKVASVEMEFTCLRDPNAANISQTFGRFKAYTAAALP